MRPGRFNLRPHQGDTWTATVTLPVDLTGATVTGQVRFRPEGELVATFDCQVVDAAGGVVQIVLPPVESVKVDRDGVWDLQVVDAAGGVQTWLAGAVRPSLEVTRA